MLAFESPLFTQCNGYGLFVCPALSKFLPRVGVRAARVEFSDIRTDAGFWIQRHNVTFLLGFFDQFTNLACSRHAAKLSGA